MRLQFASLLTLGLLISMLFTVVVAFGFVSDYISWPVFLILPPLLTVVIWLISPRISDFMYQWLYKLSWTDTESLRKEHPGAVDFIVAVSAKYNMPVPKIGIIPDDNPTAFCYGSHRGNGRLVLTRGIFRYLNEDEATSVVAHEMGHIVHRDFIVMTIATIVVQLLYEMYFICRMASRGRGGRKAKGPVFMLMIFSYVFYIISSYLILYLSRTREYYADEFSARETNQPNALMNALIKVAYGIVAEKDSKSTHRLLGSTRALGISDYKVSKELGVLYLAKLSQGGNATTSTFENVFLFDLKNPWAFIMELSSTHPLTAKRLDALEDIALELKQTPAYRMEEIKKIPVDRNRMMKNFFVDLFFMYLPKFLFFAGFLSLLIFTGGSILPCLGGALALFGASIILQTLYRYSSSPAKPSTVLEALSDPYASPIRGKPIELQGHIVGRGVPGLIYSEDMMMQDQTGLIYLNYESIVPVLGNMLFGWTKVERLIGKPVKARGWFLRHLTTRIELANISNGEEVKSHVRIWGIIAGALLTGIGILMAIPLLS